METKIPWSTNDEAAYAFFLRELELTPYQLRECFANISVALPILLQGQSRLDLAHPLPNADDRLLARIMLGEGVRSVSVGCVAWRIGSWRTRHQPK